MDQIKTGTPPSVLSSRNIYTQLGAALVEVWRLFNRFSTLISTKLYSKDEVDSLIERKIKKYDADRAVLPLSLLPMEEPETPPAGTIYLYCDTDDGDAIKAKDSEGTILRFVMQEDEL